MKQAIFIEILAEKISGHAEMSHIIVSFVKLCNTITFCSFGNRKIMYNMYTETFVQYVYKDVGNH